MIEIRMNQISEIEIYFWVWNYPRSMLQITVSYQVINVIKLSSYQLSDISYQLSVSYTVSHIQIQIQLPLTAHDSCE